MYEAWVKQSHVEFMTRTLEYEVTSDHIIGFYGKCDIKSVKFIPTLGDFKDFPSGVFGVWTELPGTEGRISVALSASIDALSLHGRLNHERNELRFKVISFVTSTNGEMHWIKQNVTPEWDSSETILSWLTTYDVCCG